jgi:hypothetical protein
MGNAYLWTKTFPIVLITSWFAGLFYLPRIFVNLASEADPTSYERLLGMAGRLYRFITILMVRQVDEDMQSEVDNVIFSLRDRILSSCNYQASRFQNYVTINDAIVDILLTDTANDHPPCIKPVP